MIYNIYYECGNGNHLYTDGTYVTSNQQLTEQDISQVVNHLAKQLHGDYWITTTYADYYKIDYGSYVNFFYITTLSQSQLANKLHLKINNTPIDELLANIKSHHQLKHYQENTGLSIDEVIKLFSNLKTNDNGCYTTESFKEVLHND